MLNQNAMSDAPRLTAAIYARFSSERQKATSIEDQISLCREAAEQFHCTVLSEHVYTDVEISGAVEQRPAYTALLSAAKANRFDAILVESQDRLWRDQGEMHHALKRLRFWGTRVYSVTAGTDLTAKTGSLLASVTGWKDEVFLEDLREKTRRGMLGQIRRGLCAGGRAYGYRSQAVLDAHGQIIGYRRIIDRDEAVVVRRIFELYVAGYSPKTIVRLLNDEKVPPPRPARGRRLRGWTWTTVSGSSKKAFGILHNPIYIGRIVWNRSCKMRDPETGKRIMRMRPKEEWTWTDAPELRIVPQHLWDRAQARRKNRPSVPSAAAGRKPKYLFSGLLICAECGSRYTLQDSTRGYYACSGHVNRGAAVCANTKKVRRDRLEAELLDALFNEMFTPAAVAYLTQQVDAAIARSAEGVGDRRARLERDLTRAKADLTNVLDAIRQGLLTPATRELLETCERRVAECEAALRATAQSPAPVTSPSAVITRYLSDLRATLNTDVEAARLLLAKLLGSVILRRVDSHLVAEIEGKVEAMLDGGETGGDNRGAGRGI